LLGSAKFSNEGAYLYRKFAAFWGTNNVDHCAVRPEGANHQWRKIPSRELSIELEADEQLGWATGRAGAS
jgi:hypothetical protein